MRFIHQSFPQDYEPTIEESYTKWISLKDDEGLEEEKEEKRNVVVEVLDTAGSEHFTALRDMYIKYGEGFMLVYGVNSLSSFQELSEIYERIKRVKGPGKVRGL